MKLSEPLRDPLDFLWNSLRTRGVRLVVYAIVVAAIFPSSRFILLVAVILALGSIWWREYRFNRNSKVIYLLAFIAFLLIGYVLTFVNVKNVDELRFGMSPWGDGIYQVTDGTYTGEGQGYRGPIKVEVQVKDHRIVGIKTLDYPDLISGPEHPDKNIQAATISQGTFVRSRATRDASRSYRDTYRIRQCYPGCFIKGDSGFSPL